MLLGEVMVGATVPRARAIGGPASPSPVALLASSTTSLTGLLIGRIASTGGTLHGLGCRALDSDSSGPIGCLPLLHDAEWLPEHSQIGGDTETVKAGHDEVSH